MEKSILRNKLFDKYFEIEDGILATNLVNKLSFIPDVWNNLHILCEKNITYFDSFSHLSKFKLLEHKQKKYLILKLEMFNYIIIDIDKMENIKKEQFINEFDETFFLNNFNEIKIPNYHNIYDIETYSGDIENLLNFYKENERIFNLTPKLKYTLKIDNAWTYFIIDFVNANAQIGFQTKDQFLYEQLFLKYDLTPSKMQDAKEKIGIKRMEEMFEKIKDIKIPKEIIPEDLYQEFLNVCNKENYTLKKVYQKSKFNMINI